MSLKTDNSAVSPSTIYKDLFWKATHKSKIVGVDVGVLVGVTLIVFVAVTVGVTEWVGVTVIVGVIECVGVTV